MNSHFKIRLAITAFVLCCLSIVWLFFNLQTTSIATTSNSKNTVSINNKTVPDSATETIIPPQENKVSVIETTVQHNASIQRSLHHRRVFERPVKLDLRARPSLAFATSPLKNVIRHDENSRHFNLHTLSVAESDLTLGFAKQFIETTADRFTLPLSEGQGVEVEIDEILVRGGQTHTFKGTVVGVPLSEVLIVFNGSAMGGSIAFQAKNSHYEFSSSAEGTVLIRKLDPLSYQATCGLHPEHEHTVAGDLETGDSTDSGAYAGDVDFAQSTGPGTADTIIDTVVGYGQQARIEDGGVDAIEARILASVDRTNVAFANSGVQDIELVLMATVEDPDYVFPGSKDGNMGNNDELGDLRNPVDGSLDIVTDLSSELGADHVAFIVKEADGAAGIAYRPGSSMVVARDYMSSTALVFPHEFAHNVGCRHAWGDQNSDTDTNISNTGWRLITPILGERKTIMAYSSWSRITYFSNPDILVDGVKTGATTGYDASNDSSVDPRLVSGGYIETAGAGFDGSNSNLGANNAEYIQNNAWFLAMGNERTTPTIQMELPAGNILDNIFGTISFAAETIPDTITETITIRNVSDRTIVGLSVSLERNDLNTFSSGSLGSTTLAADATTTLQISYSPADENAARVQLRIASTTANVPDAVINLDGFYDPPLPVIQVEYPAGQALVSGAENITFTATAIAERIERTFTVTNIGELELNSLAIAFDNNTAGVFTASTFSETSLATGESATVTIAYQPTQTGLESVTLRILSNDPETSEFAIPLSGSLDGPIYAESFEDGFGLWTNTGERDWRLQSGPTSTSSTGPSGAHDGSTYIYVEATASGNDVFSVEATFDLSGYSSAELEFRYHMYGSYTGTLALDVNDGTGWTTNVWSLSGQQQSSSSAAWGLATVDLSAYAGNAAVTLRLRGQTLGISRSDMAIDAIKLSADTTTYTLTYTADSGGSISGIATQTVNQGESGTAVEAVPDESYLFLDWSDGVTDNPRIDTNVQSDATVLARFKPEIVTRYSEWILGLEFANDLNDPEDVPLNDGIPNLIRYAYNIDPNMLGPVVLTPETGESGTPYISLTEDENQRLRVEYVRRRNAIDLIYRIEFSDSLDADSWEQITVTESVELIDATWERVTIEDEVGPLDQALRFVRVAIELVEE